MDESRNWVSGVVMRTQIIQNQIYSIRATGDGELGVVRGQAQLALEASRLDVNIPGDVATLLDDGEEVAED